ncbi:hypothetical protein RB594_006794 [Gaeumannomyces avenae]
MANPNPRPMLAREPFRSLYMLVTAASILARLPWWLVAAAVPRLRPRPGWTAKGAVMTRLLRAGVDAQSTVAATTAVSLEPGPEGDRFCVFGPFEDAVYVGPLSPRAAAAADAVVRPGRTGGTWYPQRPGGGGTSRTVVMHVHGGAFVIGNSRDYCRYLAKTLVSVARADLVFCPEYRLSGYESTNPFPAALQDVLTSYLYLTRTLSIPAENMVLSGDSAGGNLCIGLLRYIARYGDSLGIPAPGSCVLVSPWVDPWPETAGPHVQPYLSHRNYNIDYIPQSLTHWGSRAYGGGGISAQEFRDNAYMTPAGKPFATCAPIFASFGDSEVLGDDVEEWAAGMSAVEGNVVETFVEKDGVHDILVFGGALGFEDAANDVAKAIAGFLARVRQSDAGSPSA